jgi:hypothetical protein
MANQKTHASDLDPHRPRTEPALLIYDAILAASTDRSDPHWVHRMRLSVFHVAREYAQQHGMLHPTLDEVGNAESMALGHVDYASKWALYVAHKVNPRKA